MGSTKDGRQGKRHARAWAVIAIVMAIAVISAGMAFHAWQTQQQSQETQETPIGTQDAPNANDTQGRGNATGNDAPRQDGGNALASDATTGDSTQANAKQDTTSATTTTTTSATMPANTDVAITAFVFDGTVTQDIDRDAANGRLRRNPDTQYMNMLADDGEEGMEICRYLASLMDAGTLQHTDSITKTVGDDVYLTRTYTGTLRDDGSGVTMTIDMIYSASTGRIGYAYMSSCMQSVMLPSGAMQYVSMTD